MVTANPVAAGKRGSAASLRPSEHASRDANTDLLRAIAILLVVIYHVTQRVFYQHPDVVYVTRYGARGVDLFFVLSGWLIGGLLWRELQTFGNVEIGRFVGRRALRTIPPYLVALGIYTIAFVLGKNGHFDWRYLFFLQNYYEKLPYFMVSWSLCVEEHFYLVVPLAVLLIGRIRRTLAVWCMIAGVFLPLLCRWAENYTDVQGTFGYHETATHLRYDGLLLGVLTAYVRCALPARWQWLQRHRGPILAVATAGLVVAAFLPSAELRYAFHYFAVALFFTALLVTLVEFRPLKVARSKVVYYIAVASYSVYLVHGLAIELAVRIGSVGRLGNWSTIAVSVGCIGVAGGLFHLLVEKSALRLRSRLLPGRQRS